MTRFDIPPQVAEIAVIIPCHNGAGFLSRALDSALLQTRPAATIYVVDDASTDETPTIAAHYATTYPTVRLLRLDDNVGPATARNAALERIREEYVAFLDADDYWLPEHLEVVGELLDRNPTAGVAFSRVTAWGTGTAPAPGPQGPASGRVGDMPDPATIAPGEPANMLRTLLVGNLVPQSAAVARLALVEAAGGYHDGMRYAEDYDLWLRLALEHDFVYSGRQTAVRHMHEDQATRSARQMSNGAWEARERLWRRARRRGIEFSESVYRACCQAAYELELGLAWRARNGAILRDVVGLAHRVPGGEEQVRRWRWRARWVWPFWRLAAAVWDRLPDAVRAPLRRWRVRRAQEQVHELRRSHALAGATGGQGVPAARR